MEKTENPCVVIGPIGYHRLARLLFDSPVHVLITGPGYNESEEVSSFQRLLDEIRGSSGISYNDDISVVESKPLVYTFASSTGVVDAFGPANISSEGDILHPFVAIASIPTIDPDLVTDRLVREFINDLDSRIKLKRLRTFANTNYNGKSLSFIQDDLEVRIYDYKMASKKWGLDTVMSTLTVSATDKLLSGACVGITSSLFGLPLVEAAATDAIAALGTTAVKVGFGKKSFEFGQSQNPVSYLVDIERGAN